MKRLRRALCRIFDHRWRRRSYNPSYPRDWMTWHCRRCHAEATTWDGKPPKKVSP